VRRLLHQHGVGSGKHAPDAPQGPTSETGQFRRSTPDNSMTSPPARASSTGRSPAFASAESRDHQRELKLLEDDSGRGRITDSRFGSGAGRRTDRQGDSMESAR
jgi:hypothetical protein